MSRSKRKTPILPHCKASSEKVEKQKANRKLKNRKGKSSSAR